MLLNFPDGSRFEGETRNGEMYGYGIYYSADGIKCIGYFQNGNLNGKGMIISPDGGTMMGNFINNVMDKFGCFIAPDGTEYYGQIKNNEMHGSGIFIFEGGAPNFGKFRKNELVESYGASRQVVQQPRVANYSQQRTRKNGIGIGLGSVIFASTVLGKLVKNTTKRKRF